MNQNPFEMEIENPWKNKESIPYPKFVRLLPAALVYVLAALTLVFFYIEGFAIAAFVGLCVGIIYLVRMPRMVIPVLLCGFIPVVLAQSFSVGALVLGVIAGTASGALLFTSLQNPWRSLLLPAVVWTVAYVITRDGALSCLTLLTLPASAALTVATLRGERRTSAVCYTLGGFLLAILALLAVYFTQTYGSIDRDVIILHFENQRAWIVDMIVAVRDEMIAMLAEQGQGDVVTALQTYMSREMLTELVAMLYNVLPAIVIVVCSIAAYFSQTLLVSSYFTLGMKQMLTPLTLTFTMSLTSSILYLVTFFFSSFIPAGGMFAAVMQNFSIILTPGLFLVGYAAFAFRVHMAKGMSKFLYIFLIVAILLFSPWMIFSLLAFFGALSIILASIGAHMIGKMKDHISVNQNTDAFRQSQKEETPHTEGDDPDGGDGSDGEEEEEEEEEPKDPDGRE